MSASPSGPKLSKNLRLIDVYALATGATLSAGLFLLPGLAAAQAGPALPLCYLLAALPLIPAMLCAVELATAMPRAGGSYYFLDRSLGPLAGTVGGLGTWLALTLKTSFALIGIGAYLLLFLPNTPNWAVRLIAAAFAIGFGILNAFGTKGSGRFQVILVAGLLVVLVLFIAGGSFEMDTTRFHGFFGAGTDSILSTAGLVYISYVGVTNVASVSEEVAEPDKALPKAVFLSLSSALLIYLGCTAVMVGVIPMETLAGSLTPMADAAQITMGKPGLIIISLAALAAFSSVANAGIMGSSRYPLAMARDNLIPSRFQELSASGAPVKSIILTVGTILFFLLVLDPLKIAKLASAFQLLMFALLCLAVIVMRESRIPSYDPAYRTPWYPWMPILGIMAPFFLIAEMGWLPIAFSMGLVFVGVLWFRFYAEKRVSRYGAIYHVFERLGQNRFAELDTELRGILKEKGLRDQDPFDEVLAHAIILDIQESLDFEELVVEATRPLVRRIQVDRDRLVKGFMEGTRTGATPVAGGAALPHLRMKEVAHPHLVLVRCRKAMDIPTSNVFGTPEDTPPIHAIFFLISPEADPGQHLRMLAELASRVDQEDFLSRWLSAAREEDLREIFVHKERTLTIDIMRGGAAEKLIDVEVRDVHLPQGSLIAKIKRGQEVLVPGGDTVLRVGDQLTVIGQRDAIKNLIADLETGDAASTSKNAEETTE
ncbi:MAG: APA family basic amino acid/polyamine antiporter [Planctomycetota bacterium]|jgi:APA family basic amino acid/polyamine antiporter